MNPLRFTTARSTVDVWDELHPNRSDRVDDVLRILTPTTTRHLPDSWGGSYDAARAREWIDSVDDTVLLVIETKTGRTVAFVILGTEIEPAGELHLGYVLAEEFWGRGFATEVVSALVHHLRRPVSAGVPAGNPASIRVLERAGFLRSGTTPDGDPLYRFEPS